MADKTAKRRAQNVKAAQKSYIAKKEERILLQEKNSELLNAQMQLLHDKCRLEEQIKLLEGVVKDMDHIQKCDLSKTSVETETILQPVNEIIIIDNDSCEETNNLRAEARQILELSVTSQPPSAVSVVFSGTDDPKSTSGRLLKTKRVTFATAASTACNEHVLGLTSDLTIGATQQKVNFATAATTTCDEHILDASSDLAVGATQEVYLDWSTRRADDMDTVVTNSSSEDIVFDPLAKKMKRSQAAVIRPMRRVLAVS